MAMGFRKTFHDVLESVNIHGIRYLGQASEVSNVGKLLQTDIGFSGKDKRDKSELG